MSKIDPAAWDKLTEVFGKYEPLVKNLRRSSEADWLHGTAEGDLMRSAADALDDLAGALAFRTGYLMGMASKHDEDLHDLAG